MKSLLVFWREVLAELGAWCRVSTDKDWKTALARFEQEGDEFLTITLPTFGKDLETSLERKRVTPDLFTGFRKKEKLPIFLGGFLELLFDRSTGRLLDDIEEGTPPLSIEAVFAVRQLTLLFAKIEKECTPKRVQSAMDGFIKTESELRERFVPTPSVDRDVVAERRTNNVLHEFTRASRVLFRHVLTQLDREIYLETEENRPSSKDGEWLIRPKHGPGSTADKLSGNRKFDQYEWTERLEKLFPFGEYAIPSWRSYYLLDRVNYRRPEDELPVRVIAVPKTQTTPRIIAIEPTCMQYMQQAIAQRLVDLIAHDSIVREVIGFDDQVPNQQLAMEGSRDGDLATLDLSEASDRVAWPLVRDYFWHSASPFMEALDATRSRRADVQGHGVIPLIKFASMGSALTFPIEAMVFTTAVFVAISRVSNQPVTPALVHQYRGSVRVYGDDIIVPTQFATAVIDVLDSLGFKVNANKSFWNGYFRESCGADFYDGEDVSITRVRREFPLSRHDVPEVLSMASLRNQLYWAGLWKSAMYLDERLREILPYFPTVTPDSPAVGRESTIGYQTDRDSTTLHCPLVKGYVVKSLEPRSEISGEGALLKCLLHEGEPLSIKHLERQGRPDAVRLKLRWVKPF